MADPATTAQAAPEHPGPGDQAHWYKDAVIYQLHVKAFFDSNGDGIGDFRGLTHKLDYVADLGVDTIWVMPFYPSPLKDDGYDVADYRNVNPAYGTRADFAHFVRIARGSVGEVINHLIDARDQGLISATELEMTSRLAKRAIKAASGLIRYLESTPDPPPPRYLPKDDDSEST